MSWVKDFQLLLWKNFLLQKRRPVSTFVEILLPLFFMLILLLLRVTVIQQKQDVEYQWSAFNISNQLPIDSTKAGRWKIAFAPNDTYNFLVMNNVKLYLNVNVTPFQTENDLTNAVVTDLQKDSSMQSFLCGVIFDQPSTPKEIRYRLRFPSNQRKKSNLPAIAPQTWFTEFVFPFTFQGLGPRTKDSIYGGPPDYFSEGFLSVQRAIDLAIIKNQNQSFNIQKFDISMRRFPYPKRLFDPFIVVIQGTLPLLLMLSLVYTALTIVKNIVHEKEHKLKESMKIMGLRNWIHWLAWFTKCFIFLLIPMILISIIMCAKFGNGKMLTKSNGVIIFIFLVLYSISSIMFCFFISTLFSKANIAAAAGGILWFLSYIPNLFLFQYYDRISTTTKILSCLDFQLAMSLGSNLIGQFEGQGSGLQWENINKGVTVDTTFTFLQVLLMFLVDIVLYGLLTWYIEAVFPGEFGIPQKWNFPFTKSYWFGYQQDLHLVDHGIQSNDCNEFIEKYPEGLNPGISIQNLRKDFKTDRGIKLAVDDLSLNLYDGEITALLGHNGAGKTTTISMLTGLIPPSSGTAIINNYNIQTDIGAVRKSLGICPQHNVLFDHLTVEEHLWFFTTLKGINDKNLITTEVNRMIESIGLTDKKNSKPNSLSGGMKRKLSVGIALVGNSKIVILDEPTSGMDVSARRFTWDLLQKERSGRTILLTTHYMDEADVLGDRIAIMADGKLQCYGTSLFLKKKYGVGYHMVMVKNANCNVDEMTKLVIKHIPTATLENNVGLELSYILPSDYVHAFESLFSEIENQRKELGISSYGASITTLEEVFLKVCENAEERQTELTDKNVIKEIGSSYSVNFPGILPENELLASCKSQSMQLLDPPSLLSEKNTGMTLLFQRWYAMFLKRFLQSRRYKIALISQLVMPGLFVMLALLVVKTMPKAIDSPPRLLDLSMFGTSNVIVSRESSSVFDFSIYNAFIKSKSAVPKLADTRMVDYLLNLEIQNGLGEFNLKYLIGLEVAAESKEKVNATMWYNNEALHAAPVSLNAFTNALLRIYDTECSISAVNHPLPMTIQQSIIDLASNPNGFQIGFSLVFGMSFLASSFIVFLVQEKASGSKHVQFVSGVDPFSYWSSAYAWDLINYCLPIIVIVILFEIFQQEAFIGVRLGYVVMLLIFYGLAVIPFVYLFSFLFIVASTGYTRMTILNVLTGLATLLVVNILSLPSLDLVNVANALKEVFLVLPNYCLGQGVIDIFNNYQYINIFNEAVKMCIEFIRKETPFIPLPTIDKMCKNLVQQSFSNQSTPITFQLNYLSWYNPGIGRFLVCLVIQAVFFFAMVLLIEYKVFNRFISFVKTNFNHKNQIKSTEESVIDLDEDVLKERIRIKKGDVSNCVLELNGLSKVYGSKFGEEFLAVDNISLGIQNGECFGLLGQNGAGKTTTFKMLTGDETISSGKAFIDKYDVSKELAQVRQRIGYCPQFDALNDLMTGREHLAMYSRLRGVPEKNIPYLVEFLAKSLSVDQHIDKVTKAYSGGNKRKLCTAIALAGDPPLIFLDEPSSGMDPVARRMLWNSLFHFLKTGKSIVITSHFMEECEALCTRLAIMVNGQFKCIGSPQHLKNRFGEGYTLIARVGGLRPDTASFKRFIETNFPGSLLKDEHQGYLHYQLKDHKISWANLFGVMEKAKVEFNIEDYSVSQTTLEQIFLNFTRSQRQVDD